MKSGHCPICGEQLELIRDSSEGERELSFWYECEREGHEFETELRGTKAEADADVEWSIDLPPLTKAVGIVALILACSAIAALVPYSLTRFIIASAAPLWALTVVIKRFKGRG